MRGYVDGMVPYHGQQSGDRHPHILRNAKKQFDSLNFRVSFFSAWGLSARSANPAPAALINIFKF